MGWTQTIYQHRNSAGPNTCWRTKASRPDLAARNDAIELRKYQRYCAVGTNRPRWAYVADEILATHIGIYNNVKDQDSLVHQALQAFKVVNKSRISPLPESLKRMLQVKDKYNVIFDPPAMGEALKGELPAWYHISGNQKPDDAEGEENNPTPRRTRKVNTNNLTDAVCLRTVHKVRIVRDLTEQAKRLEDNEHKARKNCKCAFCKETRAAGCSNPHRCLNKARDLLSKLPDKFRPSQGEVNNEYIVQQPNQFNKDIEIHSLDEGFRIFGNKKSTYPIPARVTQPQDEHQDTMIVYTDGSCTDNGSQQARAGAGVWYSENDVRNKAIRLPPEIEQSNNTGELIAILIAAQSSQNEDNLCIRTDSQYAIDSIHKYGHRLEQTGWIDIANKEIIQAIRGQLRLRPGSTYFEKVKGHSNNTGNDGADRLAGEQVGRLQ